MKHCEIWEVFLPHPQSSTFKKVTLKCLKFLRILGAAL